MAIVHNIVAPYRVPLFAALAADPRIELIVLFMASSEANRAWVLPDRLPFPHVMLPGYHRALLGGAFTFHLNPSVVPELLRFDPDAVVIGGWDSLTVFLAALARNVRRQRRLVLWTESNGIGRPASEGWRAVPKRFLVRRADAALVPGKLSEQYVRKFARPSLRTERFPNIIDTAKFLMPDAQRETARSATRAALGIEGTTFLFVGQFIERKGVPELLEAFRSAPLPEPATLLLVGDGPLRDQVSDAARASRPGRRIAVEPFRQIDELGALYAAADAFVLPSREDPWPLVVVEAMTAGLPVLASDAVGNGPDLVEPGRSGWLFRASDPASLAGCLAAAAGADLCAAGRTARELVLERCSLAQCVEAFARAVGASG